MGILNLLPHGRYLNIIKYNKNIQKRIDININHYKAYSEEYSSIELDIIPKKGEYGEFINIKEEDEKYFHIYFNDNKKEEIKKGWFHPKNYLDLILLMMNIHRTYHSYQLHYFGKIF